MAKINDGKNSESKENIDDIGEIQEELSNYWAILVDKRYFGLENEFRMITPERNLPIDI